MFLTMLPPRPKSTRLPFSQSALTEINGFPTAVGWSYEPELNAVVFEPAHVPVNGAAVQIQYHTDGVCGD